MRPGNEASRVLPRPGTATDSSAAHHTTGTGPMLTVPTDDHQTGPRRFPVVPAVAYPPAGRRQRPLVIAGPCPWCRLSHAHHGGGVRRAGCQPGRRYWLAVSHG